MQLTIERAALLKALGHVQSVVERRNTIPILSNVLLSAGRDHTTVLHGVRRIEELSAKDDQIARDVEALTRKLRG